MVKKFFIGTAVILLFYVLVSWAVSVVADFNKEQNSALFISGIIATINIVVAFLVIYFSKDKKQSEFAKIFLGGMVVRLLAMLATIFMVFKYSDADHFVFIGSLFILYFLYQIWEVLTLNSKN